MSEYNEQDMLCFSQIAPQINVRICRRDAKTGRIIEKREGKNRVTKLALMGIVRMINGEFNSTTPEDINDYIPKYLALGSNRAGGINPGVTSEVTVNDSKLLDEISPRILLTQKNILENRLTNPFIKLTIKVFIPVDMFVGESIGEAGLFAKKTGNNCWARIAFDPIIKNPNEVFDVTWEITVMSVGTTVYPTNIQLDKSSITFTSIIQRVVLTAIISPESATTKSVTWTSNNEKVAIVDTNSGTVTPVSNGECKIRATTTNDLIAECSVIVNIE